jgi:hypothetical protein
VTIAVIDALGNVEYLQHLVNSTNDFVQAPQHLLHHGKNSFHQGSLMISSANFTNQIKYQLIKLLIIKSFIYENKQNSKSSGTCRLFDDAGIFGM